MSSYPQLLSGMIADLMDCMNVVMLTRDASVVSLAILITMLYLRCSAYRRVMSLTLHFTCFYVMTLPTYQAVLSDDGAHDGSRARARAQLEYNAKALLARAQASASAV